MKITDSYWVDLKVQLASDRSHGKPWYHGIESKSSITRKLVKSMVQVNCLVVDNGSDKQQILGPHGTQILITVLIKTITST
jgi:hypothetical protein